MVRYHIQRTGFSGVRDPSIIPNREGWAIRIPIRLGIAFLLFLSAIAAHPVRADHITAPPDRNVTFLGNFDPYPSYSDIWGYTTPTGGEWALIGTLNGTSIVDATDPGAMVEIAFITGPGSQWRDIKTWDHYAYIVTEGTGTGSGLQIVDLAASPPNLVGTYNTGFTTAHNLFIDEFGFAYVCGTGSGLFILSLADPVNPLQVGFYSDFYVHDLYVRGGIAYLAEIFRGGLEVLDVTDKSALLSLGSVTYPGADTHNVWLTDDGLGALTSDEVSGGHVRVFDVSDPSNMVEVAHYQRDEEQTVHNVTVRGNFAFLSHYVHGLRVLDVTDPRFPSEVGGFDTFISFPASSSSHPDEGGEEGAVVFDGGWGVYPYNPSGNIFISDISTGLYVLAFSPDFGVIGGTIRDQVSAMPLGGVSVEVAGGESVTSFSDGAYRVTALPGPVQLTFSRFGYETAQVAEEAMIGAPRTLDLDLVPLPSGGIGGFVTDSGGPVPLEGVSVTVEGTPLGTVTEVGGDYSLDSVPEGFYRVRFDRAGFVPRVEEVTVVEGESAALDSFLNPAFFVLDMETDPGWTVGEPGDTATTGIWVRVDPNGTGGGAVAPEEDATPDPGVLAWVTGNAVPGATIGVNDVDGGSTTLTSGPIPIPGGLLPALLTYERWYSNDAGSIVDDIFVVQISADGGSTWPALETVTETEVPWKRVLGDPAVFTVPGGEIRLRFIASDTGGGSIVEGGIDQVEVLETCQVDVNPFLPDADADRNTDTCDSCPLDPFDDLDADEVCGDTDNSPSKANPFQEDGDGDGVGDVSDNCPLASNPDQADADGDGLGNPCDTDDDNDGLPDSADPDDDGDGAPDVADVCPGIPDPLQADFDLDGEGDACDPDDGLVGGLRVDPGGRISWREETGVGGYRVRRGTFRDRVDPAVAVCVPPDRTVPAALDPFLPRRAQGFFYIVTSITGGVEGPAGFASDGAPRNVPPCP